MQQVAEHLRATLAKALPHLDSLSPEAAAVRPLPGKWSPKEILGHLIDSAGNNQQKFVRTLAEPEVHFPGYAQDDWVALQHYQSHDWHTLVRLWHALNLHLAHVIANAPEDRLGHHIYIHDSGPYTVAFLMEDYVEHVKHHLRQILPEAGFESRFVNVY
jgi:hypothetical protein